jgi:hypothetical protein
MLHTATAVAWPQQFVGRLPGRACRAQRQAFMQCMMQCAPHLHNPKDDKRRLGDHVS